MTLTSVFLVVKINDGIFPGIISGDFWHQLGINWILRPARYMSTPNQIYISKKSFHENAKIRILYKNRNRLIEDKCQIV